MDNASPRERKPTSPRVAVSPRNQKTVIIGEQSTLKVELRKAKESSASVVVVRGPSSGARFVLRDESVVGREATCEIALNDPSVSRKHARINKEGDAYRLTDLGSANGVEPKGKKNASFFVFLISVSLRPMSMKQRSAPRLWCWQRTISSR